ncbi:MAG: AAA family ATPase [Nitrospiraceae bacterium]|nr:MAG: AAA family ATPase [Nitrospiraceae bacterium]
MSRNLLQHAPLPQNRVRRLFLHDPPRSDFFPVYTTVRQMLSHARGILAQTIKTREGSMSRRTPPFIRRMQMHRPVPAYSAGQTEAYRHQTAVWVARTLLAFKIDPESWTEEEAVVQALGLFPWKDGKLDHREANRLLTARLAELEQTPIQRDGALYQNLDRLSTFLGLSATEKELLAFAVLTRTQSALTTCARFVSVPYHAAAVDAVALVLRLDRKDVTRALHREAVLRASGLVRVCPGGCETLDETLALLDGLDTALLEDHDDLEAVFKDYFKSAPASRWAVEDFAHLREEVTLLQRLLRRALTDHTNGINILIHGETGIGKTEFVRAVASSLGARLLEVSCEQEPVENDEDPESRKDDHRLRAYSLCQQVLTRSRECVVLFDEIEDVFPASGFSLFGAISKSGKNKAWTNQLLESNPVPAFWVSNEICHIDPAFRRRFLYTMEFRPLPQSMRRTLLDKQFRDLPVTADWIARIAECQDLTPAHIEQAAKMAQLVTLDDPSETERVVSRIIESNLEAQGLRPLPSTLHRSDGPRYHLGHLNAGTDLEELIRGVQRRPSARICLYGPPGGGKTAFACHLAEQVDKPLLHKKASDLLSCWVGESEKNLARMFREARSEKAVLLLDEADSFLQDRRGAHHSWEVSQVNELLVQMEAFEGLFICSTNLMDSLDQAVLRRFDLKIAFGYLKPDQAWNMFVLALKEQNGNNPEPNVPESVRARLVRLANLTPGDYATVLRQARVMGKNYDAEQLLVALEEECKAKEGSRKQVRGFGG